MTNSNRVPDTSLTTGWLEMALQWSEMAKVCLEMSEYCRLQALSLQWQSKPDVFGKNGKGGTHGT